MCPTEELKSFAQGEVPKEPFLVNILTFQADHLMQITTKLSYHKANKKKFPIKQSNKSQITNTRLQSYYIKLLERFRFYNDTIVLLVLALAKMLSCQNKSRMQYVAVLAFFDHQKGSVTSNKNNWATNTTKKA